MQQRVRRWLEALGEHILRHGWVDPTGSLSAETRPHTERDHRRGAPAEAPTSGEPAGRAGEAWATIGPPPEPRA